MKYVKPILFASAFVMAAALNIYVDKLQAQVPTPPTPTQAPAEIVLKVSPAELDIISEGLQTQPFGKVVLLMNKLRLQVIEQQPKPQVAVPVPEPKKE